jgi:hypothetical protein
MDLFRKIDIFGKQIGFEENDSIKYRTALGAVLSLLVILTSSVIGFLFGQEIYQRKESNTRFSKNLVPLSKVELNKSPLVFGASYLNGTIIQNINEYFDFDTEVYFFDDKMVANFNTLKVFDCDSNTLPSLLSDTLCGVNSGCKCFDPLENVYYQNGLGNPNSATLSIGFMPCNPLKRKCANDLDIVLRNFYISILIANSYVDANNYENPIKHFVQNLVFLSSKDFYKRSLISITKTILSLVIMAGY